MAGYPADRYPWPGTWLAAALAVIDRRRAQRPERSVATGGAAPASEAVGRSASAADFPSRITDAYIQREAARMALERFEALVAVLRSRNWSDVDLETRVIPYAPDAGGASPKRLRTNKRQACRYRHNPRRDREGAGDSTVFESVDPWRRTRDLLRTLPGGIENALTPTEIGGHIARKGEGALTKASVRAVMRNLQRLENRLIESGTISCRVLQKTFEAYEDEGAGGTTGAHRPPAARSLVAGPSDDEALPVTGRH